MKISIGGILLIFLVMIGTKLPAQIPAWNDTVITELSGNTNEKAISKRAMQIADDNTLHVAYYQNVNNTWQLFYTYRDMEDIWSTPELIPAATTYINDICLILSPYQDDIKLYGTSGQTLYEFSRSDTGNWTSQEISTGIYNISYIDATIDTQENVHIVGISNNADAEAKLIYVTNFSGTWTHDVLEDGWLGDFGMGASPVIATNHEGIAVIAYRGGTYGEYHIHLAQNEIAGEFDWNYEIITTPNENDLSCDVIIADNTIHLAHSGQDGFGFPWRTYYSKRHVNSAVWTIPQLVSGTLSLVDPTIVIDHEDNLHFVMVEVDGNFMTGLIFYSTNVSGSWVVSNPFGDGIYEYPTLQLDHAGNFQLLYIYFHYDGGMAYGVIHKGAPFERLLPRPENLEAATEGFNVLLTWDSPEIPDQFSDLVLEGYNIYRQSFGAGPFELMNDEIIIDTQFQEINLYPGLYSYYVTAIYVDEGESSQSNTVTINIMDQLPPPVFSPPAGSYEEIIYVGITSPNEIGTIHYTLDGEDPTEESPIYADPIMIDESVVIKARTFHPEWQTSNISEAEYIINPSNLEEDFVLIPETALHGARPNPFNPDTVISYSLRQSTPVNITIYNVMGQRVKVLVNNVQEAGYHEVSWNGRDDSGSSLSSGIYFYRLKTSDQSFIKKMMLLK